ncbi:MAG TPA: ATP-binding protein [Acidimicrobiales bacterium]
MLVLVVTVAASFFAETRQVALRKSSFAANAAATQSADVLTLLLDAETGVRGYALSGNITFLVPYTQAMSQLPGQLAGLVGGAEDSLSARDALAAATLANAELTGLARIRTGIAAHALSGPGLDTELSAGKQVMDEIRSSLGAIQARETATLTAKRRDVDRLQTAVEIIEPVGLVTGVIGGVTAMVLFVRSIVRRVGEVGANAYRLGLSEPLLPLPPAVDEVGSLSERLEEAAGLLTERGTDLVRAQAAAVAAAGAADAVLARVGHELRTPLTAVMGFGRLIETSNLSAQDAEAVGQILHAGDHMLRIIEEARTPPGAQQAIELDVQAVVVGPLIDEVLALLAPLCAARHLTVTGYDDADANMTLMADRQRLKQALINLVSNAVKYNTDEGRITVSCRSAGANRVRLAVTDSGPGIPAASIGRVFVPFDRLDAASRGIEGTGIGLSLSKTFVEAMDGVIGVESTVGEGSTFWIDLPAAARAPSLTPEPTG